MISALLFPYLPTRSFILIILVNPIIVIPSYWAEGDQPGCLAALHEEAAS